MVPDAPEALDRVALFATATAADEPDVVYDDGDDDGSFLVEALAFLKAPSPPPLPPPPLLPRCSFAETRPSVLRRWSAPRSGY
jgi:hypothetical protein